MRVVASYNYINVDKVYTVEPPNSGQVGSTELRLPFRLLQSGSSDSCSPINHTIQCKNTKNPKHVPDSKSANTLESTCAPGFEGGSCQCAASEYLGISRCDSTRAFIIPGFWIGQCGNESALCTGNCPLGFCTYNNSDDYQLPLNSSDLDRFLCGENRTGVLCGECRGNHSVSYHSYSYTCKVNDRCGIGWLLYIISELIPLTILFITIIVFNLSFTSGNINGFILFAQIQDSMAIHGNGVIKFSSPANFFISVCNLIYRFFNFDFFGIEELSFCLWKGANVLQVIAFKYITIVYGLGLVFTCVFIVNTNKARKILIYISPRTLRSSMIHGLTAFFVMCYSQCARISFQILGPMYLYNAGPEHIKTVVFRSGQLEMFEAEHLKYAIPAITFLITFNIVPPLLLILYPLIYKILALCNLSETRFVNCVSRYIPMQLFDSFQSSFKDKYRFFSGLYFLHRTFILAIFSASKTLTEFFTGLELFLIIILAIHAVVQPYKKQKHNIIDSLLFTNLAIINGLSLYNFQRALQVSVSNKYLLITATIQIILVYLPLVVIMLLVAYKLTRKIFKHFRKRFTSTLQDAHLEDSCGLPPLRDTYTDHLL